MSDVPGRGSSGVDNPYDGPKEPSPRRTTRWDHVGLLGAALVFWLAGMGACSGALGRGTELPAWIACQVIAYLAMLAAFHVRLAAAPAAGSRQPGAGCGWWALWVIHLAAMLLWSLFSMSFAAHGQRI